MPATSPGHEQAPRFSSPQEEALLNILRSADCLHRAFQHRLKPSGLTATQYNVLRILRGAKSTGLTCSAIGRMMITAEPDITRLLARLKTQKLIRQQRDTQDRRVVWTYISDLGIEVLSRLDKIVDQAPRELLRELTCEEVGELIRLLGKARCCSDAGSQNAAQASSSGNSSGKPSSPRSSQARLPHPRPE
jgi:DNA-binding MarR family transcriptional regulator